MIAANIESIREKILRRCGTAGRSAAEITLVAVCKTFPAAAVREAVRAGIQDIGENYIQELLEKRKQVGDPDIRWHAIGHLQRNKVRYVAPWISLIHAVDDLDLAREIDKRAAQAERVIDILVEVNTTGERSKFGVRPETAVEFVQSMAELENIRITGLMTIGPFLPDPEGSRPMFRRLRELRDELGRISQSNLQAEQLSMGMTGDFEVAIDEGATLLRIGTAIFGSRKRAG